MRRLALLSILLVLPTASTAASIETAPGGTPWDDDPSGPGPLDCPFVTTSLDPSDPPQSLMPRLHEDCFPDDVLRLLP